MHSTTSAKRNKTLWTPEYSRVLQSSPEFPKFNYFLLMKPLVEFCIECTIIEACECHVFIELDIVLCDMVGILHWEIVKFLSGWCNRVWFAEGRFEFFFKGLPDIGMYWKVDLVKGEIGLKPMKHGAFEIRDGIHNLEFVIGKCMGWALEYKFALRKKSM